MPKNRTRLITPVFRISFPNLFEPSQMDEKSKPKYGCTAIWDLDKFTARDKKRWSTLLKALDEESQRFFKKPYAKLPGNYKKGIREGAEKEQYEGYAGNTKFASLTSTYRPGVVDPERNPIGPDEGNADEIYSGCYCRATVVPYAYDNVGKGLALGLQNIQKVKDGDRLDGRVKAENDFDEEIDEEWLDDESDDDLPF